MNFQTFMTYSSYKWYIILLAIIPISLIDADLELHILHTSLLSSRYEPFDQKLKRCSIIEYDNCYGGVSRRAGFIKKIHQKNKNVLLLDGGNAIYAGGWYRQYRGIEGSHFMNMLHYDAMLPGSLSVEYMEQFAKNATFPIVCCNMLVDDSEYPVLNKTIVKHTVVNRSGHRIGIIGFVRDIHDIKNKNLKIIGKSAIKTEIELLKEQNINIIILISYETLEENLKIAESMPDIDVIVGAYPDTLLYSGVPPVKGFVSGPYPMIVTSKYSPLKTLVVYSGEYGKYIGVLSNHFDNDGKLVRWDGNPVLIDKNIEYDAEVTGVFLRLLKEVEDNYYTPVGSTDNVLDGRRDACRISECSLGDVLCDAALHLAQSRRLTNILACIVNSGGIRTSLHPGEITFLDIVDAIPFNQSFYAVNMLGSELWDIFEHSVKDFSVTKKFGKYLQVSGLRIRYNMAKSNNERVYKLKIQGCFRCKTYSAVEHYKRYWVLIPGFILNGGDGYDIKKDNSEIIPTNFTDAECLREYFKKLSPVYVRFKNRITGMETFAHWNYYDQYHDPASGKRLLPSSYVFIASFMLRFHYYL